MASDFLTRCLEISKEKSALCVGLDPSPEILDSWSLPDDVSGLREFSLAVVDEAAKQVGFVKPQVAFYERFGARGFEVLEEVINTSRGLGLFVIADAKRGDIGSTMKGYARAWFSQDSKLRSDALTVSGYLGISSLYETAEMAAANGSGLFVLAATSNPEASEVQSASIGVAKLPENVARLAAACPTGNIGLVIGATKPLSESNLQSVFDRDCEAVILAPGFGAQGAKLSELGAIYGASSHRVIASVSRSILSEGRSGLSDAIKNSKNEL